MRYEVLAEALKVRGTVTSDDKLSDAKIGPPEMTMAIPRPRGIMLTSSSARISGGSLDGGFLVRTTEEPFGREGSGEPSVYLTGYDNAEDAFLDVQRVIVSTAIRDDIIEAISGWGPDAVVVLPGAFGGSVIVRIDSPYGDPSNAGLYPVVDLAPEDIQNTGDAFAEAIDQLIADLAERADTFSKADLEDKAEILRALALPWLRKEAAQHRAMTARQHFLNSAHASAGLIGPNQLITMAELARNLYTDRGNLTRAINRALQDK
ncbi:hypothetical protein AB0C27_09825 [Nonomuraea sp. NPDC048882]|uniref:hypothetical protein n=1 Tax=Nonomuraea sp. NPDC048882 TaxID=3154347 RepID=UPI0033C002DA